MPIYAYRCETCGHAKDVLQKVSDPVLSTCPACSAETFRKQVTAAGFQLKGSGWYVTDFRGGDNTKNAAKGDAESSDAGKSTKDDSAPAADKKPDVAADKSTAANKSGVAAPTPSPAPAPAPASDSTKASAPPAGGPPPAKS